MADEMSNVQVKTDFYSRKEWNKERKKRKERIQAFILLIVFENPGPACLLAQQCSTCPLLLGQLFLLLSTDDAKVRISE